MFWFTQTVVDSQDRWYLQDKSKEIYSGTIPELSARHITACEPNSELRHSSESPRLFLPSAMLVIHWQLRSAYTAASSAGGLEAIQREQKEVLKTFCILVFVLCKITGCLVVCFRRLENNYPWASAGSPCIDRLTVTAGTKKNRLYPTSAVLTIFSKLTNNNISRHFGNSSWPSMILKYFFTLTLRQSSSSLSCVV